jgi:hypothetical protein
LLQVSPLFVAINVCMNVLASTSSFSFPFIVFHVGI